MDTFEVDKVWDQFNQCKQQSYNCKEQNAINCCSQCESINIKCIDNELVCCDCGLVINSVFCDNIYFGNNNNSNGNNNSSSKSDSVPLKNKSSNGSISKLQNWYMWSNEEKNIYKLSCYTKALCTRLDINESLVPNICEIVINVIETIKKYEGTKRARVKDGIIIVCIQYVFKDTHQCISIDNLARKIHLDIKYVTKAEKLIIELINSGKLRLKKSSILDVKKPYDYVQEVITKQHIKIPESILNHVKLLIQVCETHDLLLDHTPLSVGVCCLYYILKIYNISIDIKLFSEIYDLSVVTVIKTFNKLKQHEDLLRRFNCTI